MTRFEQFLSEHNLTLLRLERLNGGRGRVTIQHGGRWFAVSYQGSIPGRRTLPKLNHIMEERAP
jgi:hypothetical protein